LRILLAEHEAALGMFIARSLEKEDHRVTLVGDGAAAASAVASADYDLFLLDLDLPEDMGMGVLEVARTLGNGMRVLVLTAPAAELEARIACLEAGADDCMMKPFAMRELKARCRALVRRQDGGAVLRCGGLELNRLQRSLECGQESIALSRREFGLLEYLMLNRGRCVSRATLLERVWSTSDAGNTNVVDVYIQLSTSQAGPQRLVDRDGSRPGLPHRRPRNRKGGATCAAADVPAGIPASGHAVVGPVSVKKQKSEKRGPRWQQLPS
jgi:DNA-binding response OmpR family regulator